MRMRGSGLDGNSFMSNTGMAESNMGHGPNPGLNANPSRISNDGGGYSRAGYGGFIQKSNSICGDMITQSKRPGTASNLDFNRASLNNGNENESQNPGIATDNSEKTAGVGSLKQERPRTSQPQNEAYQRAFTHNVRAADPNAIQTLGSGIGAGNVNAMMEKKYSYDVGAAGGGGILGEMPGGGAQASALSKLNEQYNINQMNLDQRQRIFEDIIIQRIKVI